MLLKEYEHGYEGYYHPPALCNIDGVRGHLIYSRQPPFYRRCMEVGHIDIACDKVVCHNCGQKGHMAVECREPKVCNICGSEEHLMSACPERSRTYAEAAGEAERGEPRQGPAPQGQQGAEREEAQPAVEQEAQPSAEQEAEGEKPASAPGPAVEKEPGEGKEAEGHQESGVERSGQSGSVEAGTSGEVSLIMDTVSSVSSMEEEVELRGAKRKQGVEKATQAGKKAAKKEARSLDWAEAAEREDGPDDATIAKGTEARAQSLGLQ